MNVAYNRRVNDPLSRPAIASRPQPIRTNAPMPKQEAERVLCERCRAEMFRMHAVWRCPKCGYKTDCCGW